MASRSGQASRLKAGNAGRFRRSVTAAALGVGLLAVAPALQAQSDGEEAPVEFAIAGSNTVGGALMPALITGFGAAQGLTVVRRMDPGDPEHERLEGLFGLQPIFAVDLQRRGSSTGFKAIAAGEALIGMSSRQIRDSEVESLSTVATQPLTDREMEHVIALDGLAVVVAPDNPLSAIDLGALAQIFAGEISDWSELGLPPGPIRVHARDDQSGTYDTFESLVLDPAELTLTGSAQRYVANETLSRAVSSDPLAIGFTPLAAIGDAKAVSVALTCGIVVRPDVFTVKAEEYPLGRRLYLYTAGAPEEPEAEALVAFAKSDQAQPIIEAVGFVDQSILAEEGSALSDRLINGMREAESDAEKTEMRRFIAATRGGTRLSTTFRFEPGGDLLDGKALNDAARIARWLEQPENRDARILLAGFSDSSGGFDANLTLTQQRAEAVRRALLVQVSAGFDARRLQVDGFGPAAPIACDGDPGGAAANRRVEVWRLPPGG